MTQAQICPAYHCQAAHSSGTRDMKQNLEQDFVRKVVDLRPPATAAATAPIVVVKVDHHVGIGVSIVPDVAIANSRPAVRAVLPAGGLGKVGCVITCRSTRWRMRRRP